MRYIEAREAAETKEKPTSAFTGAARTKTGNILQYQSAVPNATNASYSTKDAFSLPIDIDKQFHDSM